MRRTMIGDISIIISNYKFGQIMKQAIFTLSIVSVLCVSCAPALTPTVSPRSTQTAIATATVPATISTSSREWVYKIVYQEKDFAIREALLSKGQINWDTFVMPPSRIKIFAMNLGDRRRETYWQDNCYRQLQSTGWCTQIFEIAKSSGAIDHYKLQCDFWIGWGNCELLKNDQSIWNGHMNGGIDDPIESIEQVGDEIAISYTDSDYDGQSTSWRKQIVLLTKNYAVVEINDAFAANEVSGKLIYFSTAGGKTTLVFDGKEVGEKYDKVFNQLCCWDGPPIQIKGNGKIIDFIARKGNDWYHV